jgi:hypothetical protein
MIADRERLAGRRVRWDSTTLLVLEVDGHQVAVTGASTALESIPLERARDARPLIEEMRRRWESRRRSPGVRPRAPTVAVPLRSASGPRETPRGRYRRGGDVRLRESVPAGQRQFRPRRRWSAPDADHYADDYLPES